MSLFYCAHLCLKHSFPISNFLVSLVRPRGGCRRRQWQPIPVFLPGKSHGWRSLVDLSPWGCKESDTTERLHFQFSLSCIGEGNGNPLQCSCLENLRDEGAWGAAIYGVAQSWTWLKWLSNSRGGGRWRAFVDLLLNYFRAWSQILFLIIHYKSYRQTLKY